ncbi:MAG: hypothetical protein ABJA87_05510 [bacterium]
MTALAGVLLGAGLTLLTVAYLERRHRRANERRFRIEEKRAAYRRVLHTLDQLFGLRPDHPEVGHLVRTLTGEITDLQLVAPPQLSELAGQCVSVALQPDVDRAWGVALCRQFAEAARLDLDPGRVVVRAAADERAAVPAPGRHAVARHAR